MFPCSLLVSSACLMCYWFLLVYFLVRCCIFHLLKFHFVFLNVFYLISHVCALLYILVFPKHIYNSCFNVLAANIIISVILVSISID